jgi:hypothetical protein
MCEFVFNRESLAVGDFNLGSNVSLAKIKQDQKLIEENEKLKTEKEALLESYKALELKVEQTVQELQVCLVAEGNECSPGKSMHSFALTYLTSLSSPPHSLLFLHFNHVWILLDV